MSEYNPTVGIARLYECTSKKGATYFRGRIGIANIVLLKSDQVSDTGQPIWYLKVQEPEDRGDQRPQPRSNTTVSASDGNGGRADFNRDPNDPIPF